MFTITSATAATDLPLLLLIMFNSYHCFFSKCAHIFLRKQTSSMPNFNFILTHTFAQGMLLWFRHAFGKCIVEFSSFSICCVGILWSTVRGRVILQCTVV